MQVEGILERINAVALKEPIVVPIISYISWKEGGFSTIHLVSYDGKLSRLKIPKYVPSDEILSDMVEKGGKRELKAHQLLDTHPNIVEIYSLGETHVSNLTGTDFPYFIIKNYKNTLDEIVESLSLRQAINYSIDLGQAISYIHSKDLVHRDIEPSNCFIDEDRLVVGDFNIADLHDETTKQDKIGKEGYSSPEQYNGFILRENDIWSFGKVFLGMLLKLKRRGMPILPILSSYSMFIYLRNHDLRDFSEEKDLGGREVFRDKVRNNYGYTPEVDIIIDASVGLMKEIFKPRDLRPNMEDIIIYLNEMKTYLG